MARAGDPKTSVRWDPEVYGWLERQAARTGAKGVGTVVQAIVRQAMLRGDSPVPGPATSTQVNGGEGVRGGGRAPVRDLMGDLEASLSTVRVDREAGVLRDGDRVTNVRTGEEMRVEAVSSSGAGTVPAGAASSPSGAAPARPRRLTRLDVVVARALMPANAGPITPVDRARAHRAIKAGQVQVSGRGPGELAPDLLVGPGEVVVQQ